MKLSLSVMLFGLGFLYLFHHRRGHVFILGVSLPRPRGLTSLTAALGAHAFRGNAGQIISTASRMANRRKQQKSKVKT